MEFNLSQLLKEAIGATRRFEVDEELTLMESPLSGRVVGDVEFLRTDRGIWVTAILDSKVSCTCSRCLEECEQILHMRLEEEFLLQIDVSTGSKVKKPEDAEEYLFIGVDHVLDLTEAVRQYAELGIPIKPLCREECAGICLECGTNLNDAPCTCYNAPREGRWSALLELIPSSDK